MTAQRLELASLIILEANKTRTEALADVDEAVDVAIEADEGRSRRQVTHDDLAFSDAVRIKGMQRLAQLVLGLAMLPVAGLR